MKMDKNNILGIVISVLLSTILNVMAENIIPSNSVSYSNSKTSETTVEGSLNELFSAVKINEKIGDTDISNIGDGTITSAISNLSLDLVNNNDLIKNLQTLVANKADITTTNNLASNLSAISNTVNSHTNDINEINNKLASSAYYKGTYTGNIDDLYNTSGVYWVGESICTGDFPFNDSGSFGYLIVNYNVQTYVSYSSGKTATRTYANNKWYDWGYSITTNTSKFYFSESGGNERFNIQHYFGDQSMMLIFDYKQKKLIASYYNPDTNGWYEHELTAW